MLTECFELLLNHYQLLVFFFVFWFWEVLFIEYQFCFVILNQTAVLYGCSLSVGFFYFMCVCVYVLHVYLSICVYCYCYLFIYLFTRFAMYSRGFPQRTDSTNVASIYIIISSTFWAPSIHNYYSFPARPDYLLKLDSPCYFLSSLCSLPAVIWVLNKVLLLLLLLYKLYKL